jgi:hypothetical protein
MYVLNPYLLWFFTVCSLNSTTATINLYSTSIPKALFGCSGLEPGLIPSRIISLIYIDFDELE